MQRSAKINHFHWLLQRFIDIHWYDWSDDLSGVDYYEIELFELETAKHDSEGIEIKENVAPIQHIKGITNLSVWLKKNLYMIHCKNSICFDYTAGLAFLCFLRFHVSYWCDIFDC